MANLAIQTLINLLKVQETWFNENFISVEEKVKSLVTTAMTGKLSYREARRVLSNIYHNHPNAFPSESINKYVREFTSSYLRSSYSRTGPATTSPQIRAFSTSDVDVELLTKDGISYLLNTFDSPSIAILIDDFDKPWMYSGVSGCYCALISIAKRQYPLGLSLLTGPSNRIDPLERTPAVDLFYRNIDEMYSLLDRLNELPEINNTTSVNYEDITVFTYDDAFDDCDGAKSAPLNTQILIKNILHPKSSSDKPSFNANSCSISRFKRVSDTLSDVAKGSHGALSELLDSYSRLLRRGLVKIPAGETLSGFVSPATSENKLVFSPGFLIKNKANAEAVNFIYTAIDKALSMNDLDRQNLDFRDVISKVVDKINLYIDDSAWMYGESRFKEVSTDPLINTVVKVTSNSYWQGLTTTTVPLSGFIMLSDEYIDITPDGYLFFKFNDGSKSARIDSNYYDLVTDMIVAIAPHMYIKPPKHDKAVAICDLPLFIRPNKTIEENLIALGFTLTKKETNNESANKPAKAGRRNRKD